MTKLTRRSLVVAGLLAAALISAHAQIFSGNVKHAGGGGGGGGGTCSNSLDFSQSCNSQYLIFGPGL